MLIDMMSVVHMLALTCAGGSVRWVHEPWQHCRDSCPAELFARHICIRLCAVSRQRLVACCRLCGGFPKLGVPFQGSQ